MRLPVQRAFSLLLRALPHTIAHGSLKLNGELRLLLAKCHLVLCQSPPASASSSSSSSGTATAVPASAVGHLNAARQPLDKARGSYESACCLPELQEVAYLLGRVHDRLASHFGGGPNGNDQSRQEKRREHLRLRDEAARRFIELRESQARPRVRLVGYMHSDEILRRVACC